MLPACSACVTLDLRQPEISNSSIQTFGRGILGRPNDSTSVVIAVCRPFLARLPTNRLVSSAAPAGPGNIGPSTRSSGLSLDGQEMSFPNEIVPASSLPWIPLAGTARHSSVQLSGLSRPGFGAGWLVRCRTFFWQAGSGAWAQRSGYPIIGFDFNKWWKRAQSCVC